MAEQVGTEPSIFTRVLRGEIPGDIVLQTEDAFVIRDIAPKAPLHLLVIPRTAEYGDVVQLAAGDPKLLAHLVDTARAAADQAGYRDFRLIFNTGLGAGQTVFHVHGHVMAGELTEGTMTGGLPAQQQERTS